MGMMDEGRWLPGTLLPEYRPELVDREADTVPLPQPVRGEQGDTVAIRRRDLADDPTMPRYLEGRADAYRDVMRLVDQLDRDGAPTAEKLRRVVRHAIEGRKAAMGRD